MKYRINFFLTLKNICNGEKNISAIHDFVMKPIFYEITLSGSTDRVTN